VGYVPSRRSALILSAHHPLLQASKRQRLDPPVAAMELNPTDPSKKEQPSLSQSQHQAPTSASQDEARRDEYLRTVFQAKLNAVLQLNRKSVFKKPHPWPEIDNRLNKKPRLSVKIISLLKDDYNDGWKTWDGTPFTELPDPLKGDKLKKEPSNAPPPPFPTPAKTPQAARKVLKAKEAAAQKAKPGPKPNLKQPARPKRVAEVDYDSAGREHTAAKSVSTFPLPFLLVPFPACAKVRYSVRRC
jgi:hypothetical protein